MVMGVVILMVASVVLWRVDCGPFQGSVKGVGSGGQGAGLDVRCRWRGSDGQGYPVYGELWWALLVAKWFMPA